MDKQELNQIVRERTEIPQGAPYQNPRYIRVLAGTRRRVPGATGLTQAMYKVMQLSLSNERASMPIYHPVPRDRAKGLYTSDEAIQVIQELIDRDQQSEAIRRGQAAQAGYRAKGL